MRATYVMLDFDGTGAGGSLEVELDSHATTNAAGTLAANVSNVSASCS